MLHQNLTTIRKTILGLTQKQMADILEVKRSAYSSYEEGRAKLPIDKINTLLMYLENCGHPLTLNELLNEELNLKILAKNY